jgi:hypothetical protein
LECLLKTVLVNEIISAEAQENNQKGNPKAEMQHDRNGLQ